MHSRIKRMHFVVEIMLGLCLVLSSVDCQTRLAELCIECNLNDSKDNNCGFVTESESGPNFVTCNPALGCFTESYYDNTTDAPGWYTRRGCLTNTTLCSGNSCDFCEENSCNSKVFPPDRPKCLKCTESECSSPKSEYCSVYLPNTRDCITLYDEDGSIVLKSCYADIPAQTRQLCDDEGFLDCKKCSGENCNSDSHREGRKCHQCEGADCLVIATASTLVDCRSTCYVGVNLNGEPVRGCSSDFNDTKLCSEDPLSASNCFVCDSDECNSIIYPKTDRLQCHTCINGDCQPSEDNLVYCSRYSKSETCATVFAQDSDEVIERGCVSDLETTSKASCQENTSECLKCNYDKCNKDDSKFKTNFCIGCNSEDDPKCLQAYSQLEKRCSSNECFTRLVEKEDKYFGRHIERGCLADLLEATTCDEPDCVTCTGRNCNNELFPENRISCKSCSLGACSGGAIDKVCNLYVEGESCLTYFGDGNEVIYRDCYADAKNGTREICDDEHNINCKKCSGSLCNIDNVRPGNKCYKCQGYECVNPGPAYETDCLSECFVGLTEIGFPIRDCADAVDNSLACGVTDSTCLKCDSDYCNNALFPTEDRLTCLKCMNDDCVTLNTVSEYCERLHSDERCVTFFDENDSVVERGCSSTFLNAEACAASDEKCLSCNFDECNVQTSSAEIFNCVSCNSTEDSKCVSNPQETQIATCTTDQCYSRLLDSSVVGRHIARGCFTDLTSCTSPDCESCSGDRCNSDNFPSERHSCYYCSGDHCGLGHLHEKPCTVYNQTDAQCMTVYGTENEVIYRDCYVDAAPGTRTVCDDENDLICSKCSGKLCNSDTKHRGTKCLQCEGIDCFTADDPSNFIDCVTGGCYVGLNSKGEMKRDCAASVSGSSSCVQDDTEDGNCLVCSDDYCNAITYPMTNRKVCLECLGERCEDIALEGKYCERIHSEETCVTVFDDFGTVLERGCLSTLQQSALCSSSSANCNKCSTDECNTFTPPKYYCVACNSKDDPNCLNSVVSPNAKLCKSNQCYSRLVSTGNNSLWQHVERGCVSDLENASTCTGSFCTACEGDRCNSESYPSDRLSCLSCLNEECKRSTIPAVSCSLYNRQKQACITLYNSDNEVNFRGCFSDAANGTQEVCDDTSQLLCTKCSTKNCNHDTERRGTKCFKCKGLGCFQPTYPSDVQDCLSDCYMGLDDKGLTIRDCSNLIENTTACGADDNGINRCKLCNDDFCNGVQFPLTNRLQCHTCNEEDCQASDDNLDYCERYQSQEKCVTVFSNSGNVFERGCSSSLRNQRYCDLNYKNCAECASTGCNNVVSKLSKWCVVCNSTNDPNCVINPTATSLTTKFCSDGCYTRLNGETLIRGCSEELSSSFTCNEGNKCKYCSDVDKCNVESYPANRKSCLRCVNAADCQSPVSELCINYNANESCATVFNGYRVTQKGCLSDLSQTHKELCSSSNILCSTCSSRDDCNFDTVRKDENCIICSSGLNANCAQKPSLLHAEKCSVPSDGQCFSRVQSGATVRGCKGSLPSADDKECSNNLTCTITSGQGLNNKIIPANRLKCFHCDSRVEASCSGKPENMTLTLPCKKYFPTEFCLKLELNDAVVRGCVSDFSSDICTQGKCFTCNNEDGCNHSSVNSISLVCLLSSISLLLISIIKSR